MYDRKYKKTLKILLQCTFLRPPESARDRLLARLSDRQAGIVSNSVASAQQIRELRFVSRFKYALVASLLIIGLFNTGYLLTGKMHAFENQENSLHAYRIIDELILDTPIARELSHAATMLIREKGETDEI